ncbi:MAG: hypothetical protein J6A12_00410 [Oscillospiraceae bacterium]|nr:hypothetical protein [Oscillospiraceae bacterium]MBQ8595154.1 hypothetical protein [Oscillospiraceae bacterium]
MKKLISLILCLIIVLSMAVSAFAATDDSNSNTFYPFNPDNNWVGPNPTPNKPNFDAPMNPAPTRPSFNAPMNPSGDKTGIRDIIPEEYETEEENPTTGAPVVSAVPAIITLVGAAAIICKRK